MDFHGWISVAVLLGVVTLFITKWIPLEATALGIPVILAATGTLDAGQALKGFGSQAVIAIGAMFIVGWGLKESGVATLLARVIERVGGKSLPRLILVISITGCLLSGFMSNAATVAVFLPVVTVLARRLMMPVSRLLMPLAFGCILGGVITLIGTTPNLILAEELRLRTGTGLGMFEFTLVGVPVAALGILYMATIGTKLLPERTGRDRMREADLPEELARNYGLLRNFFRMTVVPQSKMVGKSIGEIGIGSEYELEVVQIFRPGGIRRRYLDPTPNLVLQADDCIYLEGSAEAAWRLAEEQLVQFGLAGPATLERVVGRGVTLAEVSPAPHSQVFGKTIKELDFRKAHGLNVIAIWKRGEPIRSGVADVKLELGDAFLVSGGTERIRDLREDPDYVVVSGLSRAEDVRRAPLALLILAVAVLPPVFGWLPLSVSAIAAALMMVPSGCISLTGAQRSVDFRVLFLIIGTIPLGLALETHGVAAYVAEGLIALDPLFGRSSILAALFILAAALSMTCNNGAAAVILAPVAFQAAAASGLDVSKAFLAVAYGASCVFMLPFGNQCNLMVMGPGGYRTRDYVRLGAGLSLVMGVSTVALLVIL